MRLLLLLLALAPRPARAVDAFLSSVFGSAMVFQAGAPIVLWGSLPTGTSVSVDMEPGGLRASGVGDANGRWRAVLPAVAQPGFGYTITASTATGEKATLEDVAVGTVLLCSGQSNLSGATTPLGYCFNATESAAEADLFAANVRLFAVGEQAAQGLLPPLFQLGFAPHIPWTRASAASAGAFSGVCWMAAKELARALGPAHPLGLVESAWSGTCIQAWLPADALAACGPVPPAQGWQTNSTLFNQMLAPFAPQVTPSAAPEAAATAATTAEAAEGAASVADGDSFSGMTFAGVIYYQGESNAIYYTPDYYTCALTQLFASWRAAFSNPRAWFGVVQIAPWSGFGTLAFQAAGVRMEEERATFADAHATLATAVDLGDVAAPLGSIHPRPKQELGRRLAAGALLDLFGVGAKADSTGPVYASARAGGGGDGLLSATVSFAPPFDAPGALQLANVSAWPGLAPASGCPASSDAVCAGFELQDAGTGTWYPAAASLNADASALVLTAAGAPAGATLNATSNGFAVWPQVSLFGTLGVSPLPAYPWRVAVAPAVAAAPAAAAAAAPTAAAAAAQLPLPLPSAEQLHYLDSELTMFMHFSVCTFNDGCDGGQQNCGYHGERQPYPASTFAPTALDTDQWARVASDLGARQVCLTVHHSGGFALWPTNASAYSIKASPFGATGRDIVAEFVASVRAVGIEPCFYIVLNMDCAEANNTVERYFEIQRDMLTELLTGYGPIARMWWDMYYLNMGSEWNPGMLWPNLTSHARALAPQTLLLPGPDGCLVGGETGSGSYPCFLFNDGPTGYACQGMASPPPATPTLIFAPHEQDHTILNPGDMWWWVDGHPWLSAAELFETYLVTIGRGNTYILNMPPNTTGVIPEYLYNETALLGQATRASFSPESAQARLVNQTVDCGAGAAPLLLPPPAGGFAFDAVILEEDIGLGNQRIAGYELQTCSEPGGACAEAQWATINAPGTQTVSLGVTVGRRVIERGFNRTDGASVVATGLRFRCTAAFPVGTSQAFLRSFSAHKMAPPPGWPIPPPPPFDCHAFNCTCKGMADYYGVGANDGAGWGCAPAGAQNWWVHDAVPCEQPGYSCCAASDYTKNKPPFPGCK